ncbi:hypothetical protein Clacol_007909 [Clathrus columnatus]|uniref:Uncharacterized protein n=1 Tax=Clathrus columnatus TaxID=1419009 RepID=A0AAV5AJG8_9AGAM|nr:hypothetical protein Clacol_007909 [Clathrus columnatus]
MPLVATREFPERFAQLKKQLVENTPDGGKERLITAWNEILGELAKTTKVLKETGSDYIPQVDFSELNTLSPEKIAEIKKCGCMVIRNVVDDEEVIQWKQAVKEYATANPSIPGKEE